MSIVLPVDSPGPRRARKSARKPDARRPAILGRQGISLWRLLSTDITPNTSSKPGTDSGRLKLVTSRWVDKPKERGKGNR